MCRCDTDGTLMSTAGVTGGLRGLFQPEGFSDSLEEATSSHTVPVLTGLS